MLQQSFIRRPFLLLVTNKVDHLVAGDADGLPFELDKEPPGKPSLVSSMVASRGVQGPTPEGPASVEAVTEATKPSDSSSESSTTSFGAALGPGVPRTLTAASSVLAEVSTSSFFTITATL